MLEITISSTETWDEQNEVFSSTPGGILKLEHSLISISKWESKYHKAFLGKSPKSDDETLSYIKCMTLNKVDPNIYYSLTSDDFERIVKYIEDPMTATTITTRDAPGRSTGNETVTSELIYYWMVANTIPFECEKWHLARLLMLIQVCNAKNSKQKRSVVNPAETVRDYAAINEARRKAMHSSG